MKYKAPHRRCLVSVSMEAWHNYTELLFGSQVWGLATRDLEGNILSTPKIENVLILDLAIRKAICGHLNAGVDFVEAIALARNNPNLMATNFYAHVSINPIKTAPGLRPWGLAAKPTEKGTSACHRGPGIDSPKVEGQGQT